MKQFFKRLKPIDYILMLSIFLLVVCQTFFEMELISFVKDMLSLVGTPAVAADYWAVGWKMMATAGIIFLCILFINFVSSFLSAKIARDLRRDVFKKVNSFGADEINKFSTASLITRSTNDVSQVQMTLMSNLRMLFTAPCMAFFAIRKITLSNVTLSLVAIGFLVAMLVMLITMIIIALPKFKILQQKTDRLNLVTRENLTGIRVVRAYNAENYQEKKFENANEDLTKTNLFVNRVLSMLNPGMHLIMHMLTLSIYWIGAKLLSQHLVDYPTIATFSQYSMHIIMSFMFITLMFVLIPRGIVSLRRINEILDTEVSVKDGTISHSENLGTIEFRNVTFKYPDAEEPVLEDISFKAEKGETIAFIGSTGSGKSTLINLIPRFYDATSGQVLVDGIDVKAYTLESLRDKLGYVPQKANLFSGDIDSNMKLSKEDATEDDITKALEIAQCSFIEKLDDGYTQPVSQGGKNFSGGQKQRLSIARAFIKKPEIFIFDDSFSALDFKTDKNLRTALKKNTKDATILIVAQRVNTIKDADKIIVLNDGKMVGMGTHDELVKNNAVYKEIVDSQTKKGVN